MSGRRITSRDVHGLIMYVFRTMVKETSQELMLTYFSVGNDLVLFHKSAIGYKTRIHFARLVSLMINAN